MRTVSIKNTKRRKDYSILDMLRLNMSWYKKTITPEQLAKATTNLTYMAKLTETHPIMGEPYLKHFSDKHIWEYSLEEVPQLVAKLVSNSGIEPISGKHQLEVLDSSINNDVFKQDVLDIQDKRKETEDDILRIEENISELQDKLVFYFNRLAEQNDTLEKLSSELDNISGGYDKKLYVRIKEVIDDGNFLFLGVSTGREAVPIYDKGCTEATSKRVLPEGSLVFLSAEPIVCTYNNPRAKSYKSVDFGHVLICLSPTGEVMCCRFVFKFITNSGVQHPHLSFDSLCWGNSISDYRKLLMDTRPDLKRILLLIKQLLSTYCPSYPYKKLGAFSTSKKVYSAIPERFLNTLLKSGFFSDGDKQLHTKLYIVSVLEDKQKKYLSKCPDFDIYNLSNHLFDKYRNIFDQEISYDNLKEHRKIVEDALLDISTFYTECVDEAQKLEEELSECTTLEDMFIALDSYGIPKLPKKVLPYVSNNSSYLVYSKGWYSPNDSLNYAINGVLFLRYLELCFSEFSKLGVVLKSNYSETRNFLVDLTKTQNITELYDKRDFVMINLHDVLFDTLNIFAVYKETASYTVLRAFEKRKTKLLSDVERLKEEVLR